MAQHHRTELSDLPDSCLLHILKNMCPLPDKFSVGACCWVSLQPLWQLHALHALLCSHALAHQQHASRPAWHQTWWTFTLQHSIWVWYSCQVAPNAHVWMEDCGLEERHMFLLTVTHACCPYPVPPRFLCCCPCYFAFISPAPPPLRVLPLQRFYRLVSDRRLWLVVSPSGSAPESAPGGAGPVYTTLKAAVQASRWGLGQGH